MTSPKQAMRDLLAEDDRFKLEAYQFIREALQYAHEHIVGVPSIDTRTGRPEPRHVTGQQLCEACRLYAIDQFGYLAKMVLDSWNIHSTSDFGELVYNLIRIEQMHKSETDRREDFDDVYDFENAFEPEFELVVPDEE